MHVADRESGILGDELPGLPVRRRAVGRIALLGTLLLQQRSTAADEHAGTVTTPPPVTPPFCRNNPRCVEP